ncbi:RNA polymerase sigma factor [Dulcicalothrix desertica PCC 7102]|uniref:RNA polymerase sigma factor n=1 Tax=Dulcicalothrix desertica PCC 7102 TaxID=232991 RepID=A0A433VW49_9CYAN|nr:sigma-70 family RNA polymerase sigma factor [Dulcicalothrix desertica]RUT10321.1 RNA polymerase sigma factor [Dulcicalothrix desertica PCC 7102]TWH40707.1 RNA polymerase sigma-70 factor (ECF subfamily) [Dulcicalothrix desertica PCC 7102]
MDSTPSLLAVNEQSTDLEIFLAIQKQQVKALDMLYDRYGKLVYSTAVQILNNVEEAEEVTQETFLYLWQRSEIYQPKRGSLSSFLITMTRSRSIDRLRSRKSSQEKLQRFQTFSDCIPHYNPPLEFVTVQERVNLVNEALKQLSPDDRQLLETAYYEGLSQSEIAKRDCIPLGTVKSRARQALKKLRTVLNHLV